MIKKLSNENGSGLVLVLMVLLVLSALGSTLGIVTINSHRLANHTQDTNSAYYIAEAGANIAYEELKAEVVSVYANSETENVFFETLYNESGNKPAIQGVTYGEGYFQKNGSIQPKASIEVEKPHETGDQRTYTIKSTGTINDKTKVVEKPVVITWVPKNTGGSLLPLPAGDAAITVNGDLYANVMPTINGTVYMTDEGKLKIDNNNGNYFNGTNKTESISHSEWEKLSNIDIEFPEKPIIKRQNKLSNYILNGETRTLNIKEDSYMEELSFSNNSTLKVDTNGNAVVLVIDKMSLDNTEIEVLSGGSLTIYYTGDGNLYIKNKFIYNGSLIAPNSIIESSSNPFEIKGDIIAGKDINIQNNPVINGNIYADGNITLHGATVNGLIISTKHINFYNKSTLKSLIMAPAGKIFLQDNSEVTGSLVAKNIQFLNNVTVIHSDEYKKYLPGDNGSNDDSLDNDLSGLITSTPAIEIR